jgi:uncharacterized protein (TIGR03663 family)
VRWTFIAILLLAIGLRLYDLPLRPMHHDEASGHHTYANDLYQYQKYTYNPVYHGPLLYHAIAFSYTLFGISEVSIRLPSALFGILLVVLVWQFRKWLGDGGTLLLAALLALSPAGVYYSRFALHDTALALFTLATVYFLFRFFDEQTRVNAVLLGASLGLVFTVKESAYFFAAALVAFGALELFFFRNFGTLKHRALGVVDDVARHFRLVLAGIAGFAVPFVLLYASFFRFPANIWRAVSLPVAKWFELATTWKGHQKPATYYFELLGSYETAIFFLGLVGLAACLWKFREHARYRAVTVWLVLNTAAFFILKYKTPWLIMHVGLPFAVAAGLGVPLLFDKLRKQWMKVVSILAVIGLLAFSLHTMYWASFVDYDNSRTNKFVYVQTTRNIFPLVNDVKNHAAGTRVTVAGEEYTWALFWYFRQKNVSVAHERVIPAQITDRVALSWAMLNLTGYRMQDYDLGHHGVYHVYFKN